jgi:formate dehydrogenase subunit gamma
MKTPKSDPQRLLRYTPFERANHWLSALTFLLLALSGLVFFQPLYYPLSALFGGGTWTRILHPFIGVAMTVSFGIMFFNYRRSNLLTPTDRAWLKHVGQLVDGDESGMPESGKFNGGQKLLFWLLVGCMLVLILSGIVIWRAWFSFLFPVTLIRLCAVLHALAATVIIALILFHIYAAIWTKESIDAMLYGWVRKAWAKQHHAAWFRETTGGGK